MGRSVEFSDRCELRAAARGLQRLTSQCVPTRVLQCTVPAEKRVSPPGTEAGLLPEHMLLSRHQTLYTGKDLEISQVFAEDRHQRLGSPTGSSGARVSAEGPQLGSPLHFVGDFLSRFFSKIIQAAPRRRLRHHSETPAEVPRPHVNL